MPLSKDNPESIFVVNVLVSPDRIPAWCIVKVGQLLGVSFEIQGIEHINRDKGAVVLINHQSAIDLIGESLEYH